MKVNDANQYIKDSLKAYCDDTIPERAFEVKMPHVLFLNEHEFEEISKARIHFDFELPILRFIVINIGSFYYLIAAGDENLKCDNTDFSEAEINNAIFLGCVESLKLKVPTHISPYQIIEDVCEPTEDNDKGYPIETICKFFEPIKAFHIPEEIAQSKESLLPLLGKIIVSNIHLRTLQFSESTMNSYVDFFDSGFFDYNIINSFLSYCWRYSFLDVYRCLEPLFRHLKLPELKAALGIDASIDVIGDLLDKHCGWRPQETGSMQQLFDDETDYLSVELKSRFKNLGIGDNSEEKVGKLVYQLRNRIVHHQDKYSPIENLLTPDKWDKLIMCMLDAITELRKKFPY